MKRALALLGLLLFVGTLVLVPMALYADTLYRSFFGRDAAGSAPAETAIAAFDLLAEENAHQMQARISGWQSMVSAQEVEVSSPRGTLSASLYEPVGAAPDAPWAIVFHGGVTTDREQVRDVACTLSINGFRVLTPDLYAHGGSEGAASTLGFGDAKDVYAWVDYAEKTQPGAKVVLFGQDEGAAAVLTAASGGLSASVRAVAADSACDDGVGYMLKSAGVKDGSLQAALLKLVLRRKAQRRELRISPEISLAKVPLLLIHGTGDEIVPAWHSEDIAAAAGERAQLLFVEGAGHGLSRYVDPEAVYDTMLRFFQDALQ